VAKQQAHDSADRLRQRRRIGLLLVPVLLLALIGELLAFAPWETAATLPDRLLAPLPLAAVDPIGADTFLEREVDHFKKEQTADLLKASGVGWIKQEFPWSELEFSKTDGQGYYFDDKNNKSAWAKFDEIVAQAEANSISVIARLDRTPAWAARPQAQGGNEPPAHFSDFGDFVHDFVTHYKGRIHFLQIWNEPNLEGEWVQGQRVNPSAYVALLQEAATRARAVDPDIVILSAPLATTNEDWHDNPPNDPDRTHNMRETVYLDALYAAGAAPYFDIASANAFGYNSPPEEDPQPDRYNFRRVEALRAVMERRGDSNKPIWITEYAWNAPDTTVVQAADIKWGQVTLDQQADYTVRGIRYARAHWPWVGVLVIWYFRQVGDYPPTDAQYYFSMVTPDFVPRPIYAAVQAEAARLAVAGPGRHSALSASVQAGPGWGLHLARDPAGSAAPLYPLLVTRTATATLEITFRGTDLNLQLAPTGAATGEPTPRFYVMVDNDPHNAAPGLPRDAAGRAYIDGASATVPASAVPGGHEAAPLPAPRAVTVVAALGNQGVPGVHRVQLQGSGAGAALAGFEVYSTRSYVAVTVLTGTLIVVLLGDLLLLRRSRRAAAV